MVIEKRRVQLLVFIVGIVILSITAEKCRLLVGEDASSKSGQFTILNCFDMASGSAACAVKEGVKLYFYNIRAAHVEGVRHRAIEAAIADALTQGLSPKDAAALAQKEGAKAAKLATRKAKRIIGPIISSGWDFFEALYYGGTMAEGFLRGTGTLFGAYSGGFLGEQKLGRFGYLVGSTLGSWVGGRIGLMAYDVVSGVHFLLQLGPTEASSYIFFGSAASEAESPTEESSEKFDDSPVIEVENMTEEASNLFYGSPENEVGSPSEETSFFDNPKNDVESAPEESSFFDSPAFEVETTKE